MAAIAELGEPLTWPCTLEVQTSTSADGPGGRLGARLQPVGQAVGRPRPQPHAARLSDRIPSRASPPTRGSVATRPALVVLLVPSTRRRGWTCLRCCPSGRCRWSAGGERDLVPLILTVTRRRASVRTASGIHVGVRSPCGVPRCRDLAARTTSTPAPLCTRRDVSVGQASQSPS